MELDGEFSWFREARVVGVDRRPERLTDRLKTVSGFDKDDIPSTERVHIAAERQLWSRYSPIRTFDRQGDMRISPLSFRAIDRSNKIEALLTHIAHNDPEHRGVSDLKTCLGGDDRDTKVVLRNADFCSDDSPCLDLVVWACHINSSSSGNWEKQQDCKSPRRCCQNGLGSGSVGFLQEYIRGSTATPPPGALVPRSAR